MGIDWTAFDWISFSTLVTGALAVTAALVIGTKQAKIIERQNSIAHRQTEIEELRLRHDLFDRRYEVYESVRNLLLHIIQNAEGPTRELERSFLIAKHSAQFLFDEEVQLVLKEIWVETCGYQALKSEMSSLYRREGHYGEGNPQRESEKFSAFVNRLESLGDVFSDMNLSSSFPRTQS